MRDLQNRVPNSRALQYREAEDYSRLASQCEQLCQVHGFTACAVANLFAATEAVCQHDGVFTRLPYCREKNLLARAIRYVDMLGMKTKRSRQTTAAAIQQRESCAHSFEQHTFSVGSEQ